MRVLLRALVPTLVFLLPFTLLAQTDKLPFTVSLEQQTVPNTMPALQSTAAAAEAGYWLFVGGRIDGLHPPFGKNKSGVPFAYEEANRHVWLVHMAAGHVWRIELPAEYQFSLAASNAQSHYKNANGTMYILGGYGAASADSSEPEFMTFDCITAIDVKGLIHAVTSQYPGGGTLAGDNLRRFIKQRCNEERVRVTGGALEYIPKYDTYYQMFGQNCIGQYCDSLQAYTFEIRSFRISPTLELEKYAAVTTRRTPEPPAECVSTTLANLNGVEMQQVDEHHTRIRAQNSGRVFNIRATETDHSNQFRRRDLSAGPIRLPQERTKESEPAVAAYGGVFTKDTYGSPFGLAYVNPVYMQGGGLPLIDDSFEQRMNAYETLVLPLYDSTKGTMYTVLFGGITMFEYNNGSYTCNTQVPFSNWISVITRGNPLEGGKTTESVLAQAMPGYLGANSAFMPETRADKYFFDNDVLNLERLPKGQSVTVGYMYGGIEYIPATGSKGPTNKVYAVKVTRQ